MVVNVSVEWTEYIRKQVASGAYGSAEEVLDEALRVWQRQQTDTHADKAALRDEAAALIEELESGEVSGREYPAIRAAVQVGLDQLDRGEGIPGDVVREELLQRSASRRRSQP